MSVLTDIRRAAFNYLARREHSALELTRKLQAKEFALVDIQLVISALQREGLQSNQRFTENYLHYRRNRGFGPVRIRAELLSRGIDADMIEDHLNISDNAWLIDARQAWQKQFKGNLPTDFKIRAKQIRFLLYRGFTMEHIETIFQSEFIYE